MVFLSRILGVRFIKRHTNPFLGKPTSSHDPFWRKRKVLMNTAHLQHRKRNCWTVAICALQKQLQRATWTRKAFRKDFKELCTTRIEAGAYENGYNAYNMQEALARSHIHLNRKVLANLAIWEPRSFRSVCAVTAFKENQSIEEGGLQANHPGPGIDIITRGKL